jgi:hypothetical protein
MGRPQKLKSHQKMAILNKIERNQNPVYSNWMV